MITNKTEFAEKWLQENEKLLNYIVYKLYNRYKRKIEHDDLYQLVIVSLMKAIERYDETRGMSFNSFCIQYIIWEVIKFVRDNNTISISRYVKELYYKIKRCEKFIDNYEEIAEYLKVDINSVFNALLTENMVITQFKDNNGIYIDAIDLYEDNSQTNMIENKMLCDDMLKILTPMERKIIEKYYFEGKTQLEISKELKYVQNTISKKLKQSLEKMRQYYKGEKNVK